MNKILVPFNNREKLKDLVEAGVDEFYMGFNDESWNDCLGEYAEINRMSGFGVLANPYSFDQLFEIVQEIKAYEKAVFITINSAAYNQAELDKLRDYFKAFAKMGVDGVIVSTPELTKMAFEEGLTPVASTMCGLFNSDVVKYYKSLGMTRMILPRDLSMAEIESIVKENPELSYEVFLMRNGCQFSDSHCLGFHRRERGSVCGMLNSCSTNICSSLSDFKSQHDIELNNMLYVRNFHRVASCGLCALYRFVKMGIASYKVVGRSELIHGILEDVKLIKQNLAIIESCSSEEEYLEKMAMPKNARVACKMGLNCYYPEIRF